MQLGLVIIGMTVGFVCAILVLIAGANFGIALAAYAGCCSLTVYLSVVATMKRKEAGLRSFGSISANEVMS